MTVQSSFPILSTADLERLVSFYERALGAVVAFRFPDPEGGDAYVSLSIGPASLGIARDPGVERSPAGDPVALWFYVDDTDAAFAEVHAAGARVVSEPADMPWGERVAQVRDPDGNLVNLGQAPVGS